jgi:carbonic anhydrase/acetyltransferase-like protein (isoleucine patch superfamily)
MIAAVIDNGRPAADRFTCRGRDLAYWLSRSFPFCRFVDLPCPGHDFASALVFGPALLPEVSAAAAGELRRRLRQPGHAVFAAPGRSFFLVSASFLQASGIALEPGIFARLSSLAAVVPLAMANPVTVLDPKREALKAEAAVVSLQVRWLQKKGVLIENLGNFYMEGLPVIGRGSLIGHGVSIKGDCRIGRKVAIGANSFIENSRIGDGCIILPGSVIRDSVVEPGVQLGPYCHLRNGSLVKRGAKLGNFVEMKKSVLGRGSKAMHLTYIGDARVGKKVNIGAGTITCNYDGEKKNPTTIGDNVFIGSGTELVAPVTINSDSYVGAGSTITEDVPRHALALARQRQKNIPGWVLRKRAKKKK